MKIQFNRLKYVAFFAALFTFCGINAQVSCEPAFPNQTDQVTIIFDASQGNGALAGFAGPVFAHMGVITNQSQSPSDWKHVSTTWGINDPIGAMINAGPNLWKKTFTINTFFNIGAGETVKQLAFVFRNQDGSKVGRAANGADIYYTVYPDNGPLQGLWLKPSASSLLTTAGASIPVKAAVSKPASLQLFDNGVLKQSGNGEVLETSLVAGGAGVHKVELAATAGAEQAKISFIYVVAGNIVTENPPAGTEWGVNYVNDQTVRLCLYAPQKQVVYALGDFNDWTPDGAAQMKRGADGATWWIELSGLTPGKVYGYQFLVDGVLRVADPLSTLVLDPANDPFISPLTFPNMPPYPAGKTEGIVSLFQTAQPPFNWTATNYQRPSKTNLVVYELLPRDFVDRHDYQTLTDTLDYFEKLGVTAVELMPVNEFDGNISWGYNPSYHKALDKYYGDPKAFKTFVDECHKRNIAVILDVVFNHVSGSSPLAQLYWDAAGNRPAATNPWLNPFPKHDFNVFNDFNHESQATKTYVKNCLKYWLSEYKIDGFRFDLSKGFTQKLTVGNTQGWGLNDPSRISILKNYADAIWAVDPSAYVILEHFAENIEEKELSNYGMMLWGNMYGAYREAALGFNLTGSPTNLSGIDYKNRGWNQAHLVGYMESHDEERISYGCKVFGNLSGAYNVKWLPVYTRRMELMHNLLFTVPGPKMLWQFGETAYDFSINTCENGTIDPGGGCRTSPKPIRWDYYNFDPYRRRLYDVTAALLQLRKSKPALFQTADYQLNLAGQAGRTVALNSPGLNLRVVANTDVTSGVVIVSFPHTGTWYEYYTGKTLDVTSGTAALSLAAGEYRIYTDQLIPLPSGLNPTPARETTGNIEGLEVYPNPAADRFYAAFALRESAVLEITITDVAGKVIASIRTDALPSGDQQLEFDAAEWMPGNYFITLRDETGAVKTRKIAVF